MAGTDDWRTHHDNEVQFLDKIGRHKATSMLVTGASMGIFGFFFAATAGFWDVPDTFTVLKVPFPSGNPHFPLTVSEMVHDPRTPTGKVFLGFELVAAILLLSSWYPYQLSNVYIGERHGLFSELSRKCGCVSWATLRQFLPCLGLALVALVSTTPTYERKDSNVSFISCQIHILAATALFGGYILVEMHCLFIAHPAGEVKIGKTEKLVRSVLIALTALTAVTTIVMQFSLPYLSDEQVCCHDVWQKVTADDLAIIVNETTFIMHHPHANIYDVANASMFRQAATERYIQEKSYEVNTASGAALALKKICFWSEVLAGVFGLTSHIVIWYFAPERQLILGDYIEFKELNAKLDDDDEFE